MSFLHLFAFSRLKYLLILILILPLTACLEFNPADLSSSSSSISSAKISWVAPSAREDNSVLVLSDMEGYRIYYGARSGDYSTMVEINDHTATQAVLTGLPSGIYFVVVTAVDVDGRESLYSAEVVITV